MFTDWFYTIYYKSDSANVSTCVMSISNWGSGAAEAGAEGGCDDVVEGGAGADADLWTEVVAPGWN